MKRVILSLFICASIQSSLLAMNKQEEAEDIWLSWPALLLAVSKEDAQLVKRLLNMAEKLGPGKAWALITLKDYYKKPALTCANREIKNILETYRPREEQDALFLLENPMVFVNKTLDFLTPIDNAKK